jgi:hypothetical protein
MLTRKAYGVCVGHLKTKYCLDLLTNKRNSGECNFICVKCADLWELHMQATVQGERMYLQCMHSLLQSDSDSNLCKASKQPECRARWITHTALQHTLPIM